jgi:Tat protein secretion system quality control protein TatD with DNase activity
MIAIGTASDDWTLYCDISHSHPDFVHYTIGLRPRSVGENRADDVSQIEAFWNDNPSAKCIAMIDTNGTPWERVVFHCFAESLAKMSELLRHTVRTRKRSETEGLKSEANKSMFVKKRTQRQGCGTP